MHIPEGLRDWLDAAGYWRTRALPAYPTRQLFPFHDLAYWWSRPALGSCSHPSRYHRSFARQYPQAFQLYSLLFLHHGWEGAPHFPGLVEGGRALVQVTAIQESYILSSIPNRTPGEFVYLGDDATLLLDEVKRESGGGRALDMACGCGVIGLNLPPAYTEVEGLDLNATAIDMARANLRLNPRPATRFEVSDLWEKASGGYDLVIGNPPSLPMLEGHSFAFGQLTPGVLAGLEQHLAPGGLCLLLVFSLGDELWEGHGLSPEFSLDYRILDEIRLRGGQTLHQVLLKVRRDGLGRRGRRGMSWGARLRRLAVPGLSPEPFPQQERLRPTLPPNEAPVPPPPA